MTEESYANIRDILGHLIGRTVVDITQHDKEDFVAGDDAYVELMFDDGNTLKFFTLENKHYKAPGPFCFSDPNTAEKDADEYVPTEDDKSTKGWIVVEKEDTEYPVHVIPNFGRNHILNMGCWCNPALDPFREDPIVNHNEERL